MKSSVQSDESSSPSLARKRSDTERDTTCAFSSDRSADRERLEVDTTELENETTLCIRIPDKFRRKIAAASPRRPGPLCPLSLHLPLSPPGLVGIFAKRVDVSRGSANRIERCSPGVRWHAAQKHIMPPVHRGPAKRAGILRNRDAEATRYPEIFCTSKIDYRPTGSNSWRRA